MSFVELDRDEYLYSVKKIADFKSLKFSKQALDSWDNYYSWEKFPPLALQLDGINKAYLFYNISKDNRYLTINNLFTPKAFRNQGMAYKLLSQLFTLKSDEKIERFKMFCVSSSLSFYNYIGLEYWGVNTHNQYYCDYQMPKKSITEIFEIVKNSSVNEFTTKEFDYIYKELQLNGSEFDEKQTEIFKESLELLGSRYHHKDFIDRKLDITKL
ncbi:hypothetical protein [Sulfurimonas sp.]